MDEKDEQIKELKEENEFLQKKLIEMKKSLLTAQHANVRLGAKIIQLSS